MRFWRFVAWTLKDTAAPLPDDPISMPPPTAAPVDVIRRGQQANRLLYDQTLADAFNDLRRESQQMWMHTTAGDVERREELYRITQALEMVRVKLINYRESGRKREQSNQDRAA